MELTNTEIQVLKQLLATAKHSYDRGFRCECGHIAENRMTVFKADDQNTHGMVCKNCGEISQWEDVKIKTITFNLKKVKIFNVIEEI